MADAAGEAFRVSYLMASTHPQPPAMRLPSPDIYICGPPRLRPHRFLPPPSRADALLATPFEYGNDQDILPVVLFDVRRMVSEV